MVLQKRTTPNKLLHKSSLNIAILNVICSVVNVTLQHIISNGLQQKVKIIISQTTSAYILLKGGVFHSKYFFFRKS